MSRNPDPSLEDVLDVAVSAIGGEYRAGQVEMAKAVEHSLTTGEHLIVQAGTGTGKSLAYIIPALLHHDTVVVATATIALQTQLIERDIPAIVEAVAPTLGRKPTFAVLKGRSNYVCLNRVFDEVPTAKSVTDSGVTALFDAGEFTDKAPAAEIATDSTTEMGKQAQQLRVWAKQTHTGDKLELEPAVDERVWRAFSVSGRECMGQSCPMVQDCFAEIAREKAKQADIVVTNHSLLAIDVLENVPVLPEHTAVVVDEAHELIDRATSASTRALSVAAIERAAQRLRRAAGRNAADLLFDAAGALADALLMMEAGRFERPVGNLLNALALVRDAARSGLGELGTNNSAGPDSGTDAGARQVAKADLDELFATAGDLLKLNADNVAWMDQDAREGRTLYMAPLSVAGLLRACLFDNSTVILTSATLKLGGDFDALAASVGLFPVAPSVPVPGEENQDAGEVNSVHSGSNEPMRWRGLDVGSPFDFATQGICYVAADLPERAPRASSLSDEFIDRMIDLVTAAGGRTLGLFSSKWAAQAAAEQVRSRIGVPLMTQWDAPLPHLIDRFAAEPRSCLFGTLSLWQGVDVPGFSCTLVIIDKIPFPRPDDPLVEARQNAADAAGRSGFMTVSVPRASLMLAQGAGRLIRTSSDRGVVAILDPRLQTARYGAYIRKSLPPFWFTTETEQVLSSLRSLDDTATIQEATQSLVGE